MQKLAASLPERRKELISAARDKPAKWIVFPAHYFETVYYDAGAARNAG